MRFVHDRDRMARVGMPEAVLSDGKSDEDLRDVVAELRSSKEPALLTRLPVERLVRLGWADEDDLEHDPLSETAFLNGVLAPRPGRVAVVAAGTSDARVAAEAARTLHFSGIASRQFIDVGVAALWRLQERVDALREHDVVIVVAGMDAALASVVGGLVSAPVVAVPTSVGYGVARDGVPALMSMLASCAQGVTVVNIDNGFGAACSAIRILGLLTATGTRW